MTAGSTPGTGDPGAGGTAPAWTHTSTAPAAQEAAGSGLPVQSPAFPPSQHCSVYEEAAQAVQGVTCQPGNTSPVAELVDPCDHACLPWCHHPAGDRGAIYRQTDTMACASTHALTGEQGISPAQLNTKLALT